MDKTNFRVEELDVLYPNSDFHFDAQDILFWAEHFGIAEWAKDFTGVCVVNEDLAFFTTMNRPFEETATYRTIEFWRNTL